MICVPQTSQIIANQLNLIFCGFCALCGSYLQLQCEYISFCEGDERMGKLFEIFCVISLTAKIRKINNLTLKYFPKNCIRESNEDMGYAPLGDWK